VPFLGRLKLRFSAFWLKQVVLIVCWVEELLLGEDKLEHGTEFFFNHSTVVKKAVLTLSLPYFSQKSRFLTLKSDFWLSRR